MKRLLVAMAVTAFAGACMAQGYYYQPDYLPAPPSNHPASQNYRDVRYETPGASGAYYDYNTGTNHTMTQTHKVQNSAFDPGRNYRQAGSTQKVDQWVWRNGQQVRETGERWTGASGQSHHNITATSQQVDQYGNTATQKQVWHGYPVKGVN